MIICIFRSTRSSRNLDTPNDSTESLEVNNESSEVKTPTEDALIPGLENDEDTKVNNDNQTESVPEGQTVNDKELPETSLGGEVSAEPENSPEETTQCNNVEPVLQSTGSSEEVTTDCEQKMDVVNDEVQCPPVDQPEENKLSDESSEKSSADSEQVNEVENQGESISQESTKPDELVPYIFCCEFVQ